MSDTLITAQELRDKNPSELPELTQNLSKSSFWYYTRLSTADTVLNQASFRVSNLKDMNDLDEVQLHADNQDNDKAEYNTHTKQSQKSALTKHFSNCHIFILKFPAYRIVFKKNRNIRPILIREIIMKQD